MTEAPFHAHLADAPEGAEALWLDAGDARLRAVFWMGGQRGTVILMPGRTEYVEKYGRVIAQLVEREFSVACIDWRGQGLSARHCVDPMKGHVINFSEYQRDLQALLAARPMQDAPGPQVLMCHSMGGCIGMRALVDKRLTPVATIMSGPMLDIELTNFMRLSAKVLSWAGATFRFPSAYAPQPGADEAYVLREPFETNLLTHDEPHYEWMKMQVREEPGFALGGPTLGWMAAAFRETRALMRAPATKAPTLMFLGQNEEIVAPAAILAHDLRAPACRLSVIPDCKHECLMETPEVRTRVWREIDEFLDERGV